VNGPTDSRGVVGSGDGGQAAAKQALRDLVLGRRDALAGAAAGTVLCFASFRSEVDTTPLIAWWLARDAVVALPRIVGAHHMEAYAVTDLQSDLVAGRWDIPEPRPGLPLVDPVAIDVVIVPGSAFDRAGGRMGYGGGFYDTFLARLRPDARRIGICFDLQVVERVPCETHDLCVDLVVTESRAIETGCRPAGAEA